MSKPQQPELHRSGRGNSDPSAIKTALTAAGRKNSIGNQMMGKIPKDNQRGHHPKREQDKPEGRQ